MDQSNPRWLEGGHVSSSRSSLLSKYLLGRGSEVDRSFLEPNWATQHLVLRNCNSVFSVGMALTGQRPLGSAVLVLV